MDEKKKKLLQILNFNVDVYKEKNMFKYTVENESVYEKKNKIKIKKIAIENGYKDAFIVAFLNDKKISVSDALTFQNN